ncbi:hypothetical protein, partial [Paraburkholderia sp. Ac-20347]|uniref:hypothetical protein n=1 Tax=Paraburkholderia sp. Ac-20347 TaxID=2703892 RepID=UPI00197E79C9
MVLRRRIVDVAGIECQCLLMVDSVEKLARRWDCSLSWKTSIDGGYVMMGHQGGVQNQLFYSFN